MSYFTLSSQEHTFFTLLILSHAPDNTTSLNIGGTNAWAVPHLKFLRGTVPQSSPRSPPLYTSMAQPVGAKPWDLLSSMGNVRLWHMLWHHTEPTGCRSFMIISRCRPTLILTCKLNFLGCSVTTPCTITEY